MSEPTLLAPSPQGLGGLLARYVEGPGRIINGHQIACVAQDAC